MTKAFRWFVAMLGCLAGCIMCAMWADANSVRSSSEVAGGVTSLMFGIAWLGTMLALGCELHDAPDRWS